MLSSMTNISAAYSSQMTDFQNAQAIYNQFGVANPFEMGIQQNGMQAGSLTEQAMLNVGAFGGARSAGDASVIDYLNGESVGDTSSLVSGMSTINSKAVDAATAATEANKEGKAGDEPSATGKALSSARVSYMKANFPGMTDEQIAALDNFYTQQYAQYETQMNSFLGSMGAAAGSAAGAQAAGDVGSYATSAWGSGLAKDAESHATGPGGWCFKYVSEALARNGVTGIGGASAYMAADQLANRSEFKEVSGVSEADLKKLPAGAVVVWDRGNGHEHGHICVSLGDGREASDKIRNMTQGYGTSYRVFMPNK